MVATRKKTTAASTANNGELTPAHTLEVESTHDEPSAYFLANPPAAQLDLSVLERFTTHVNTVISLDERAHLLAALRDLAKVSTAYETLRTATRRKQQGTLVQEHAALEQEIKHLNTRMEKQYVKKSDHKQILTAALEQARAEVRDSFKSQISDLHAQVIDLEHKLAEKPTNNLEVQNAALQQSLDLAREEWGKSNREVERLKAQAEKLAGERDKLKKKLEQKDLHIGAKEAQIRELQAVNAALTGEDPTPGCQDLYMIREKIHLLEKELKAKQDQSLIALFANEHLDQLDALNRRVDYYDRTQQELTARVHRISELEQAQAQAQAQAEQNARIAEDTEVSRRAILSEDTGLRGQIADLIEFIESKGWTYAEGQPTERADSLATDTACSAGQSDYANGRTTGRTVGDHNASLPDHSDHQTELPTDTGTHRLLVQPGTPSDDRISQQAQWEVRDNTDRTRTQDTQTGATHYQVDADHSGEGDDQRRDGASHQQTGRNYRPLSAAYRKAEAVLSRYQSLSCTAGETELTTTLRGLLVDYTREAELRAIDGKLVQEYYDFKAWLKDLWHNDKIESPRKVAEVALRLWHIHGYQDEHGYADIEIERFSKTCGFSRQTGSRMIKETVSTGAHSMLIDLVERTVPDKRREGGTRTIQQKHYRLAPTRLRDLPKDLHKPEDIAKHGGAGLYCHICGRQGTLRRIYHTICVHEECLHQDINFPPDIQALLDRARTNNAAVEAEDAPAAVAEAERIMQTTAAPLAPVVEVESTVVQDEQQCAPAPHATPITEDEIDPDIEFAHKLLARMVEHRCTLTYDEHNNFIIGGSARTWSDKRFNALASQLIQYYREVRALYDEYPTLIPQFTTEVQDEHQSPVQEETLEELRARLDADMYAEIAARTPGWSHEKAATGKWHEPLESLAEETATPVVKTHKAVDLTTRRIMEVQE
jgi:hypothetical protein